MLEKTVKQTGDIILYDNQVVLYKSESDVMMVSYSAAPIDWRSSRSSGVRTLR